MKLYIWRRERGLRQIDLRDLIKDFSGITVTIPTISNWEREAYKPQRRFMDILESLTRGAVTKDDF